MYDLQISVRFREEGAAYLIAEMSGLFTEFRQ